MSLTTTSNSVLPPLRFYSKVRIWLPIAIAGLLGLTIVALVGRMRSRAWRFRWMLVAGWVFVGIVIAGCGGGNTIVTLPPTNNGTPPGAYSVTVYVFTESNASDGSNANADASVSIPVTVN